MSLIYMPLVAGAIAASSALVHDPYIASVVQLAHMDGTNGAAGPFPNSVSRGNTITTTTGAVFSNAQVKFGTTSLRVGTSLQNAKAATHADYNFGTSAWTIEFWLWLDSLTLDFNSAKVYYDSRPAALTNGFYPTIFTDSASGNIKLSTNGVVRCTGANGSLTATAWHFITACKKAGTTRLFVDGSQVGSDYTDSDTYVQSGFFLLSASNGGAATKGYMDDLRITNGVGRYGAGSFSVPTAAFPNV